MSMNSPDTYIPVPYQTTAEATVEHDERVPEFVLSVFPEASAMDIEKFRQFVIGYFHSGLEVGIELGADDPIQAHSAVQAYLEGVEEGKRLTEPKIYAAFVKGMFETFKIATGEGE